MIRIYIKNLSLHVDIIEHMESDNNTTAKLDNISIPLIREQIHYLKNVMRLKDSSIIHVFDDEAEFEASIAYPYIKICKILRKKPIVKLPKIGISYIKRNKLEVAVEKATELGVSDIYLLMTERVNHKHINIDRLHKIVIEAAEQCGRIGVPQIHSNVTLPELPKIDWIVANQNSQHKPHFWKNDGILIGPEGGWSERDLEHFKAYPTMQIHQNVLRSETAVCTALSLFEY